MSSLKTIILAAGKGTRMKSRTPKVLHEIYGRPIISYVLDVVKKAGSLKTYVVLGHQIDQVKKMLPPGVEVVEQKKLLGTADAVKSAARHFKNDRGDVFIVCGDTPLIRKETLRRLASHHRKTSAVCTVLTAVVEDSSGYGRIIRSRDGKVLAIREEKDADEAEKKIREINVGLYCFRSRDLFDAITKIGINSQKGEYYLTDIVAYFETRGLGVEAVQTQDASEGWGINTRIDLALCADAIRYRILEKLMLSGITVVDPATTYVADDAKIGTDTVIKPFTVIEKDVRIGQSCTIGPFARLRPGTRIGDNVEIGNFTEVSRTTIGAQTLMKHFSFLGDARIGKHVNIGAGTITANFDGKNKNTTTVLDGAFIGSDSVLVAPVKIGEKSVTGAGSVLTAGRNVPDGRIAVGVPARIVPGKTRDF